MQLIEEMGQCKEDHILIFKISGFFETLKTRYRLTWIVPEKGC